MTAMCQGLALGAFVLAAILAFDPDVPGQIFALLLVAPLALLLLSFAVENG